MNKPATTLNHTPKIFADVSPWQLIASTLRVYLRMQKLQGVKQAIRVIPIIWVIIQSVRGFAKYHILESIAASNNIEDRKLSEAESQEYKKIGLWLRQSLQKFGPTFIKIGQTLSTRADLLPLPAMLELAVLQEDLPPYPIEIARKIISQDLGAPPEKLYKHFDPAPIAAASLCQAYKALLSDGRKVVVKVQRPNLLKQIAADVQILEAVADELMTYPSLCRHTDWPGVVQEFARTTFEEIDYIREGRNADRFRHNFRNNTRIYIPKIIWRLTGRRVLTIEYVDGVKVTDVATLEKIGLIPEEITTSGTNFYLSQLLIDGFFHADPHPGNLRIMADGRVGFFDFGMVGNVTPALRQNMIKAFLHIVKKEYLHLIDDFIAMGFLTNEVDRYALVADLSPIIEARFSEGISVVRFRKILFDFSEIVWKHPFRLPTEFTYIMRALLTLEGVALTINPDYNFIETALPFAQKLLLKTSGEAIRQAFLQEVFNDGRFRPQAAMKLLKAAALMANPRI